MHLSAGTLDDLLLKLFKKILQDGERVNASKGWNTELFGVLLELRNSTARLRRTETKGTVFSCLGETLWYLGKSNELAFIEYYISGYRKFSDDRKTVHGAYPTKFLHIFDWELIQPSLRGIRVAGALESRNFVAVVSFSGDPKSLGPAQSLGQQLRHILCDRFPADQQVLSALLAVTKEARQLLCRYASLFQYVEDCAAWCGQPIRLKAIHSLFRS
jgi:hypothetical protein